MSRNIGFSKLNQNAIFSICKNLLFLISGCSSIWFFKNGWILPCKLKPFCCSAKFFGRQICSWLLHSCRLRGSSWGFAGEIRQLAISDFFSCFLFIWRNLILQTDNSLVPLNLICYNMVDNLKCVLPLLYIFHTLPLN